ncbi:MAG: hypothetical protein RI544_07140, partial [Haloquadratum sp.]|nr:hypothetical protein [Haloquadratum sp.]
MRQGRTLLLAALVVTGLLVGLGAVTAAEGDPTISMSSGSTPAGADGVIVDDGLTVSGSGAIAGARSTGRSPRCVSRGSSAASVGCWTPV